MSRALGLATSACLGTVLLINPGDTAEPAAQVRQIASLGVPRAAHQATPLPSGEVLITGGCAREGCDGVQRSAELFDPATMRFRTTGEMRVPRVSHSAELLTDGRVLIVGGWTDKGATADAELWDPATGRFTRSASLSNPVLGAATVRLDDGRVLVIGGERDVGAAVDAIEAFDPRTGRFEILARMTMPRSAHSATLLADGRVLIVGGHRARRTVVRSAEIFDPASRTSRATDDLGVARHKHAAVSLVDGRVLVVGGSDEPPGGDVRHDSTEIYDPRTGRFTRGPSLGSPRHKLPDAVATFPSNGAVVVGGGDARFVQWLPGDAAFRTLAPHGADRAEFATLTALRDGRLLFVGGYDRRLRPQDGARILDATR